MSATVDLLVSDIHWEGGVAGLPEFTLTHMPWHEDEDDMREEIRTWLMLETGTAPDTFDWIIL